MLMLILAYACKRAVKSNFNTSHVNVNQDLHTFAQGSYIYFNTSHVNVNPFWQSIKRTKMIFQYISC